MPPLAFIGPQEWIWIVVVLVLLFGVRKLPEIGKSLAEGINEFKKASRKVREDDDTTESKPSE